MILTLAIVAFFISIPLSSKAVEVPFTRDQCNSLKKLSHKWIMCQTTGKYSDDVTVTKKDKKMKKVKKEKKKGPGLLEKLKNLGGEKIGQPD